MNLIHYFRELEIGYVEAKVYFQRNLNYYFKGAAYKNKILNIYLNCFKLIHPKDSTVPINLS